MLIPKTALEEAQELDGNDELVIIVDNIRTDGNRSVLGEIFFEINGTVDVELTIKLTWNPVPVVITVSKDICFFITFL